MPLTMHYVGIIHRGWDRSCTVHTGVSYRSLQGRQGVQCCHWQAVCSWVYEDIEIFIDPYFIGVNCGHADSSLSADVRIHHNGLHFYRFV